MSEKHKILVLSDLNSATEAIVTNATNLARIINADVSLFCVKKATEVVSKESQLSAMRSINQAFIATDNSLKTIINNVAIDDDDVHIKHKVAFGNLKENISKQIAAVKPSVIVLGKSKSKTLSFLGDKLTDFILKEFNGTIMISSDDKTLEANDNLDIGYIDTIDLKNNRIKEQLFAFSKKPIKLLQTSSASDSLNNQTSNIEKVVLSQKGNTIASVNSYVSNSPLQLLFLNRNKNKTLEINSKVSSIAKNLNCSLLITNKV